MRCCREILDRLRRIRPGIDEMQTRQREVYVETYDLLIEALESWPMENGCISWPIRMSEAILDLVKQGDWMARIFILFYGLGMHLSSRRWFAIKAGSRLIKGILQPLEGSIPAEWAELISWIQEAVEV